MGWACFVQCLAGWVRRPPAAHPARGEGDAVGQRGAGCVPPLDRHQHISRGSGEVLAVGSEPTGGHGGDGGRRDLCVYWRGREQSCGPAGGPWLGQDAHGTERTPWSPWAPWGALWRPARLAMPRRPCTGASTGLSPPALQAGGCPSPCSCPSSHVGPLPRGHRLLGCSRAEPAPHAPPPRRPQQCHQSHPALAGRAAISKLLALSSWVWEHLCVNQHGPAACAAAGVRASALTLCACARPKGGRGLEGGGARGETPGGVWQPAGESRAGGVRASPRGRGSEGRARARGLCASRVRVCEPGTCLRCCLRWGRLQERGVSTQQQQRGARSPGPAPRRQQHPAPQPNSQAPAARGKRVEGAGVGIWWRNHRPTCLVTPGHGFWCCPGPAPRAVSPSPTAVAAGGWAGTAARLPHLCVQVPAEPRRARRHTLAGPAGRCACAGARAGQGAAGCPWRCPALAACVGRQRR